MPLLGRRFLILMLLVASACGREKGPPSTAPVAMIQAERINESSGLVASRKHAGVFWTHNDSGDTARIFAIDRRGRLLSEYEIKGAKAVDWEDIAVDADGGILIADVGNNRRDRRDLVIYVVPEPDELVAKGVLRVVNRVGVSYPDGRFDCEGIAVEADGSWILAGKTSGNPGLYALKDGKWIRRQTLKDVPGVVTGMDIASDGRLAVSTYNGFCVYERRDNGDYVRTKFVLSEMKQCEAVAWDGARLMFTNEQRDIHVYDPDGFRDGDILLPPRDGWSPDVATPLALYRGNSFDKCDVVFKWKMKGDEYRIEFKLPASESGEKEQQLALLFSTGRRDGDMTYDVDEETIYVLSLSGAQPRLTRRRGGDRKATEVLSADRWKLIERNGSRYAVIRLPADFVRKQYRFAVAAIGFDKQPAGWPFGFWRINGKPFMWSERQ